MPGAARWASRFSSLTINLALDLLSIALPRLKTLDRSDRAKLIDQLSFRFLFFEDSPAMSNLRKSFPETMWLSRHHLDLEREP